ncbi:hypothetical protein Tco_0885344 [Tanacetum coccineum]
MAFPRLQKLAARQNTNDLTDAMSVYIKRKINDDLYFAAGLSHLWEIRMIPVRLYLFLYYVHGDDEVGTWVGRFGPMVFFGVIVFGKKGTNSIFVMNLSGKVVQYNLISKMLHDIFDYGFNQLDDNHDDNDDELLQQLEAEHNVYEFIPSFASVCLAVFM